MEPTTAPRKPRKPRKPRTPPVPPAPPGKPYGGPALVTIGRGGSTIHKYRDAPWGYAHATQAWHAGSVARTEGYDRSPGQFLDGHPDLAVGPEGCPIIDTRTAVAKHGATVALRAPLVDPTIDAPLPAPTTGGIGDALMATGGTLGAMVAAHRAGAINLDAVPVADAVAYWHTHHAITGTIHRTATGLEIVWSDPHPPATYAPPLYLSRSGGAWRVIYQGATMCADTTEDRARAVYTRHLGSGVDLRFIWDGDRGAWITIGRVK